MNYTLDLTELREKLLLGNEKVQEKAERIEQKTKGIQYLLHGNEWKSKINS